MKSDRNFRNWTDRLGSYQVCKVIHRGNPSLCSFQISNSERITEKELVMMMAPVFLLNSLYGTSTYYDAP